MNKYQHNLLSAAILGLLSSAACAESADIYLGAGAGFSHFQGLNKLQGVESGTEDAAAANAFVGVNLNDYLGAELGYLYAGRGNTDGNRFENQGGTLSLVGRIPLIYDLSLLAEAGGYWSHSSGLGTSDNKVSSLFGTGLAYKVNDALDLQARWRYMADVSDLNSAEYNTRIKPNQTVTTLEAVYHPFRNSYVAPVVAAPIPPLEPEAVAVDKTFELSSDVLFAFGKAELKAEGVQALAKLYQQLAEARPINGEAIVIGYTDRLGSARFNQQLSEARAEKVANYLVAQGMPAGQIRVEGHGAEESLTGSDCDGIKSKQQKISCLAPDRRVEIRVTGTTSSMQQE
ncbi:OmpA family protein [Aeromonas sp. CA23]|uniref:OmpA family protein n=1 Tax=Aeromonas sp. CA23 TaxID=2033032 RepID=UPI0020A443C4|nr:OmpA family protein [Aeromonas sp. CA23]